MKVGTLGTNLAISEALTTALENAKKHRMTPSERWQQRVSFAFGNVSISNPDVTLGMVEKEAERLYGPCPK